MKNIATLIRQDFTQATRNVTSVVMLVGVVLIPSFFGWFNVLSSWAPFDNVKNLKVAVANADKGYQSDLFPLKVNVGEQVVSSLRANSDINWVFVSEDEAIEGTKSEKYYAAIVLPPSFSQDMMTFLSPGAKPTELAFYINEKKNALSPIIVGEAATDVSAQINESFTKTLDEVGLALVSDLANHLESSGSRDTVERLQSRVGHLATQLKTVANTTEMFGALISSSKPLVESAASLTTSASDAMKDTAGAVGSGAAAAGTLRDVLRSATTQLANAFSASANSHQKLAQEVDQFLTGLQGKTSDVSAKLSTLSAGVGQQIDAYTALRDQLRTEAEKPGLDPLVKDSLQSLADRLTSVIERQQSLQRILDDANAAVVAGTGDAANIRAAVLAGVNAAKAAVDDAHSQYTNDLKPKLERLASTLESTGVGFAAIERDLGAAAGALQGSSGSLLDSLTTAETLVGSLASDLRNVADRFTALDAALGRAAASGDLSEVTGLIGSDPATLASQLTQPVALDTIPVFKVDNFGSQMAPLYTVLGLWVGSLLLSVLIRPDVSRDYLPPLSRPLRPAQQYFGRYTLFGVLALFQSTLLYVGLIGFVGVRPVYPLLLILAGWVMSLVFSLVTYTLVLSFGEAGKAFAVLLLVVQISAGGGAYPLSVLPQWFQNISPFVPVSHATTAVRAAIAGIYENDYWIALGWLLVFVIPTLLIGLVLRLPVRNFNEGLNKALESTKLM